MLEEIALYIAKKVFLYRAYNQEKFYEELNKLIDNKILLYNPDNTVSPQHDIDYRELLDIFDTSQFKGIFSQYAYEFLIHKTAIPEKQKLLCKHAREAAIVGWENMNFRYGKSLAQNRQYYDAQKIFLYLSNHFNKIHIMHILFIAINSYETGNYRLAIEQLNTISVDKLRFSKAKYYYFFYMGKSYNNIGDIVFAAKMLQRALEEVNIDSREYVQTLNVLHMYYFEINGKRDKSLELFEIIRKNYKEKFPDIWANTMRGCHNFLNNDEAIGVLQEAESILEDELEKAYIKTTTGFLYVKNNRHEDAKIVFQQASETIKRLKIHEYSYAANNYAVCHMLNREYRKAKEILQEALLWNRTEYGKVVLQNHLMICCLYLQQHKEAWDYYNNLIAYIGKHPKAGGIIKRKLYLNLSIASRALNQPISEKYFLQNCSKIIENTASEWRYYSLIGNTENCPIPRPKSKSLTFLDFEPWFLVYAHD